MHVVTATFLIQAAAAADTVVMELSTLQKVLAVAEIGAVLLAYVLMGALLFAVLKMAKAVEAAKDKIDDVRKDIRELIDNGNKIVAKGNAIVDSVRKSVDGVAGTVDTATHRAQRAVSDLADRVDEFNHTLSLVQSETQTAVVGALAAIKGVKAGLGAMRGRRRPKADLPRADDNGDGFEEEASPRPRLKRRAHARH
jgi:uncharacterized protein YoxC